MYEFVFLILQTRLSTNLPSNLPFADLTKPDVRKTWCKLLYKTTKYKIFFKIQKWIFYTKKARKNHLL